MEPSAAAQPAGSGYPRVGGAVMIVFTAQPEPRGSRMPIRDSIGLPPVCSGTGLSR
jgi:hypothetical protein